MPITIDNFRRVVRDFCEQYPTANHFSYRIVETPHEIYSNHNGDLSALKATIIPKPLIHSDGRILHAQLNLIAKNTNDLHDANETLRHEVLGHYGINTFTTQEKNALLDALIAARQQRGILGLWNHVDLMYPGVDVRQKAEEVYATFCERISSPGHEREAVRIRQEGKQSFYETCVAAKPRRMTFMDLENITRMVVQGLHDQTRTQQHFPHLEDVRERNSQQQGGDTVNQQRLEKAWAKNSQVVQDLMAKQKAIDAADADIERFDALDAKGREQALAEMAKKAAEDPHYRNEVSELSPSIFAEIEARNLAEKIERVKNMSLFDAAKEVNSDMQILDSFNDEQVTARDRHLKEMMACSQASPHYQHVLKETSPQFFVEGRTHGFNENGTFVGVLGKEFTTSNDQLIGGNDEAESLDRLRARARSEADVLETPEDSRSELLTIDDLDLRGREFNYQPGAVELEELRRRVGIGTPEDSRSELLDADARARREAEEQETHDAEVETAIADRLRATKEREQRLYMMDLDNPTGKELGADEFILPRSVAQKYVDLDGKFYTKEKPPRIAFEDRGNKLRTSSTDKGTIADMIAVARAKQWNSLKLSGSKEFRREAWLEAESQGLKTAGYSPKKEDLVALEALRQERATNNIQPGSRQTKQTQQDESRYAPRHDLNKNQAQMHATATACMAMNLEELKKNPALANRTPEALEKLAFWRGIVQEMTKHDLKPAQDEALTKYDKAAENPDFLERLERSDSKAQENATHAREEAQRKEPELSL